MRSSLSAWAGDPQPAQRDRLADAMERLHGPLVEHLDVEERELLPLAASHLTEAEWHELGAAAVAAIPKSTLPLLFGMLAYEGDPAVLHDMLRAAPALPRLVLPRLAPRRYARHARRIHATSTP